MAKAFYRIDTYPLLDCGVSYRDDPELHELFFKASLLRASRCGIILTTPDLKTVCQLYRPGERKGGEDMDFKTDVDGPWEDYIARAGGREAIDARYEMVSLQSMLRSRLDTDTDLHR